MNWSGSSLARSRWKRRMRLCAAAVCFLQLASALSAAEPGLVKLAVSEGKDIRFSHLTSKDGLSPGQIRDIVQDNQGFLWFNTSEFLNRYDGYHFKSYTRDAAHPNYPAGLSLLHFQGPVRGSLGQLQRISRALRSRHGDLDAASRSTTTVHTVSSGRSGTSARTGPESFGWPPRPACTGWMRRTGPSGTTLTIRLIRRV